MSSNLREYLKEQISEMIAKPDGVGKLELDAFTTGVTILGSALRNGVSKADIEKLVFPLGSAVPPDAYRRLQLLVLVSEYKLPMHTAFMFLQDDEMFFSYLRDLFGESTAKRLAGRHGRNKE